MFSFHDEDDVGPLEEAGGYTDARVARGSCGLDVNVLSFTEDGLGRAASPLVTGADEEEVGHKMVNA